MSYFNWSRKLTLFLHFQETNFISSGQETNLIPTGQVTYPVPTCQETNIIVGKLLHTKLIRYSQKIKAKLECLSSSVNTNISLAEDK